MTKPIARILVVDDEKLIRWSVSERLQRRGYAVQTAESGEQALEAVRRSAPDVLLLDVKLPGIDGVETLRRALLQHPDAVVVMMSAHSTVDVAVEAMKHGATDFLVKPFKFDVLDAAVERALAAARTRRQIAGAGPAPGGAAAADALVGTSSSMEALRATVARLGQAGDTTVLVEGESGVGKGLVARAIHAHGSRAERPCLQVSCAALPESVLEGELFGHEAGGVPDAPGARRGAIEAAEGGSLLVDEIGELSPGTQAKLLRLLEARRFRRLGGAEDLAADVRLIASTNTDLEERVQEGRFRADLWFRLNVVRVRVPALRERVEDVPALTAHFVARFNSELGRKVRGVSAAALDRLAAWPWPGNVRELRNVVERAFVLHAGVEELRPEHLSPELSHPASERRAPSAAPGVPEQGIVLDDVEKGLIAEAMERANGNQSKAARLLGVSRDTLRYRLKKFGLG